MDFFNHLNVLSTGKKKALKVSIPWKRSITDNLAQSELAAAFVVESLNSFEGELPEKPTSPKHRAALGEDEVVIPR